MNNMELNLYPEAASTPQMHGERMRMFTEKFGLQTLIGRLALPVAALALMPPTAMASEGPEGAVRTPEPRQRVMPVAPRCTKISLPTDTELLRIMPGQGTVQSTDYTFYRVNGYTAPEVRSQLQKCAPMPYEGWTQYNINSAYNYYVQPESCRITDVAVGVHVNYILPKWKNSRRTTRGLAKAWGTYSAGLTEHELGHGSIAIQGTQNLKNRLSNMSASPDCPTADQAATAIFEEEFSKTNQLNVKYDDLTKHGATQGAKLILPK